MFFENFKMALRSIAGNKLRTLLTMLGIIIGVGAVVAINGLGQGLKKVVTQEVSNLGANAVIVTSGNIGVGNSGDSSAASKSSTPNFTSGIGTSTLTDQDVQTVRNNPRVEVAAGLSLISGVLAAGANQDPTALLFGTSPDFLKANPTLRLESGRSLQANDAGASVVVLGSDARDKLFGKDANALGKTVSLRGQNFTVIGVVKTAQAQSTGFSSGPSFAEAVYIPTETAQTLTKGTLQLFRILGQARSAEDVAPAVTAISRQIKKDHGGQSDFSVVTQKDILSTFDTILNALTGAISAIAGISLLVGGIGIMNIMLVSVTERTREIGLRKAIGATSANVLSQFLIEAVVLTLLGGTLGIAFAYGLGMLVGHFANLEPVFSMGTIILAFGISAAVGIIFGIAPAIKAARMRPIDALRHE